MFLWKNVKAIEIKHLTIGQKTKLQDGVYVDALSCEGVSIGDSVVIGSSIGRDSALAFTERLLLQK